MIAKCVVKNGKISQAGYLPCFINEHRQPEVLEKDETGQKVFDFVEKMTKESGLNTRYKWKGNEVVII
jgi:poly-gamma-glutamate synthesis protein (capsule biosynthesis protein)